jgi:hypothetical protein
MFDSQRLCVTGTERIPASSFPFHKTHIHPTRKATPDPVPTFFWAVVTLLLSVSVALICWGAYNALPQTVSGGEKHLQHTPLSSKFNPTGAEASGVEVPELVPEPELEELAVVANGTGEPPLLPSLPPVESPAPKPMGTEPPPGLPKVDASLVSGASRSPLVIVPVPVPPPPVVIPTVPPPVEVQPARLADPAPPGFPFQVVDTNPLVYRESSFGDTPMMRNWKTLTLCSLMTTAIFVQTPAPVAAGGKEKDKSLIERIDSLQETIKKSFEGVSADIGTIKTDLAAQKSDLKEIRDDMDTLKTDGLKYRADLSDANMKIKLMQATLKEIRADLDGLRTREPLPKSGLDKTSIDEIKVTLANIEQAILKLQPSSNRIALSPPSSPATGRVMLVNVYPEELLFVVNQKTYRVAPGATMPLDGVPAGVLNYEVISGTWGLRARSTTNLAPGETFTLTAR